MTVNTIAYQIRRVARTRVDWALQPTIDFYLKLSPMTPMIYGFDDLLGSDNFFLAIGDAIASQIIAEGNKRHSQ